MERLSRGGKSQRRDNPMPEKEKQEPAYVDTLRRLISLTLSLPWLEILSELWKVIRALSRGLADEGLYEVLSYESTLELKDKQGKRAEFRKRERVKYLQNHIIAYQDQAWGDGEILLDYRCTPGQMVDQYRPGQKTYVLISLHESKSRGDIDEFHIEWRSRNGFTRSIEQWETEINHRTKHLEVKVIFPEGRPPIRLWLVQKLQHRAQSLHSEALKQLPDGRWLVAWETQQPRLSEHYILKWEW